MHVSDDQQHRTVQLSHVSVQSLQAAAMHRCAVDELPWISLGSCWQVCCKLLKHFVSRFSHFHFLFKFFIQNGHIVHVSLSPGGGHPVADSGCSKQEEHRLHPPGIQAPLSQNPLSYSDSDDAWTLSL